MNKKTNTIALISLAIIISSNSFAAGGRQGGHGRDFFVASDHVAGEVSTNHALYEGITMMARDAEQLRTEGRGITTQEGFAIAHGFLDSELGDRVLDKVSLILSKTGKAIYNGLSDFGAWVSSKFKTSSEPGPTIAEPAVATEGNQKGKKKDKGKTLDIDGITFVDK